MVTTNQTVYRMQEGRRFRVVRVRPEPAQLEADALPLLAAYEKGEHDALLAEVDRRSKTGPLSADCLGPGAPGSPPPGRQHLPV